MVSSVTRGYSAVTSNSIEAEAVPPLGGSLSSTSETWGLLSMRALRSRWIPSSATRSTWRLARPPGSQKVTRSL